MQQMLNTKKTVLAVAISLVLGGGLTACGGGGGSDSSTPATVTNSWMTSAIIAEQAAATTDSAKEAVANRRAQLLLAAMTLAQKMQQLTGAMPERIPELPNCLGGRHVTGISALNIPTLRITNGPVGLGQNDCVDPNSPTLATSPYGPVYAALGDPSSAKATALPSAIAAAASFDPTVAGTYGDVIGTEMNNLALHVFEAPGMNLARLSILGRNFEYFGEDPFLTGTMGTAEVKGIQAKGAIGMPKHFVANEQETNRMTIQETVDRQALRELYLLPFEMVVKDSKPGSIMCAYNYVNGAQSCENKELLTDILRTDWGFSGYVQSDFLAMKSTVPTMAAGMDHEMPFPTQWAPANLTAALASGALKVADLDTALVRRYTQMFRFGIFDRPVTQTAIDFAAGGVKARDIGVRSAVLLQNNGVLPFNGATVKNVVLIGKTSQVYAQQAVSGGVTVGATFGGGSSDVMPNYTVAPLDGIKNALKALGNTSATVKLILVDDANTTATIDGVAKTFADVTAAAAAADAVIVMAGTISEEGADRASFTTSAATTLAKSAAAGMSLDWYVSKPNSTSSASSNTAKDSQTFAMIQAIQAANPTKTALVLKDNAAVAMDPALVGSSGPAILEVWFPGQEDGNIVADLVFGQKTPSGKLPVTFPYVGKSFLDSASAVQFPGVTGTDGVSQQVTYTEGLHMGYRWYDGNISGQCAEVGGVNPCVAFPFGHGLSYNSNMAIGAPTWSAKSSTGLSGTTKVHTITVKVTNNDTTKAGTEVVQVYASLPVAGGSYAGLKQPPKRLVGFKKVEVAAGASADVVITVNQSASNHPLSFWSQDYKMWITPPGTGTFYVGKSSSMKDLQSVPFTN